MRLGKHDGPEGAPAQAGRSREPKWARFGHPLHERHRATGEDRPLRVRRKNGHSTTIACSQNLVAPCSVLAFRATRFPRHRLSPRLVPTIFQCRPFPNCFFPAQLSANRFRFRIGISYIINATVLTGRQCAVHSRRVSRAHRPRPSRIRFLRCYLRASCAAARRPLPPRFHTTGALANNYIVCAMCTATPSEMHHAWLSSPPTNRFPRWAVPWIGDRPSDEPQSRRPTAQLQSPPRRIRPSAPAARRRRPRRRQHRRRTR